MRTVRELLNAGAVRGLWRATCGGPLEGIAGLVDAPGNREESRAGQPEVRVGLGAGGRGEEPEVDARQGLLEAPAGIEDDRGKERDAGRGVGVAAPSRRPDGRVAHGEARGHIERREPAEFLSNLVSG